MAFIFSEEEEERSSVESEIRRPKISLQTGKSKLKRNMFSYYRKASTNNDNNLGREVSQEAGKSLTGCELYHFYTRRP